MNRRLRNKPRGVREFIRAILSRLIGVTSDSRGVRGHPHRPPASDREENTHLVILKEPKRLKDLFLHRRSTSHRDENTHLVILKEPKRPKDLVLHPRPASHREENTHLVILKEPKRLKDLLLRPNARGVEAAARTSADYGLAPRAAARTFAGYGLRILLLLCLALTAAAQARPPRHRRHHAAHGASVGALRGRLQSVRSRKAALRAQLRKTTKQAHVVLGDIHVVDERLSDVKDRLQDTTDHLTSSRAEQIKIGRELDAATQRVGVVREQVRRRLRAMYIHGTPSPITAMVDCTSVGEVVSRGYLMRTVARKDQALFTEYKTLRLEIADHKEKQDRLVKGIHLLALRQSAQSHELAQDRQDKQEILGGLRAKQGELEASIAQFEQDEQEIGAEIASYSRRSRPAGGREQLPAFTGNFSMPVQGARISDPFGMRYHPILHRTRMHEGVDLAAPEGTPIHAAADGVVMATTYMRGYGNVVFLDHGGGVTTVYGHCSRILSSVGQHVRRGETIAAVGMTGLATGPHCHFEVRINNHPVNPMGRM